MAPVVAGRWEVMEKLREGGMGAIYRVRDLSSDAPRVLKVMKAAVGEDLHARDRFLREAEMARRLSHPNVARLYELGEALPGTFYMVMELIDGPSLADVAGTGRLLPVAELLDLAAQALDGLAYLHGEGIVHRDVSPENLMVAGVEAHPVTKVIDLGVAKRPDEEGLTTTGIFVGKLRYASPEQLGALPAGEAIDGRSDVYAMGCVLYLLLTGAPPYLAETPQAWIRQHLMERPRPFARTDRAVRVPEPVRHAVLRALSKKREDRFRSAADFAAALRSLREEVVRERGAGASAADAAAGRLLLSDARALSAARAIPATPEDLVSSGLCAAPPAQVEATESIEEATVRLSSERRGPGARAETRAPGRRGPWIALAASLLLVGGGAAAWLATRDGAPPEPAATGERGVLLVVASPWGRVVSVTREASAESVPASGAVTPCRLEVPAGRWRVVVRGADGAEAAASCEVGPGAERRVDVALPGFDLESAVSEAAGGDA